MYEQFLHVGLEAIEAAKTITLGYFGKTADELHTTTKTNDIRFTEQSQKSPVTLADQEAEQAIRQIIHAHFPDHGIIGEEGENEQGSSAYQWNIDPIDGTRDFARGLPTRAIMLGIAYQGEMVVAIICTPVLGDLVWATKGGGTRHNSKRVQVSNRSLADAYLLHSRNYYFEKIGKGEAFDQLCKKVAYTKSTVSRQMIYIATGACDLIVTGQGIYYDNAPGSLLITEAGGVVTTLSGTPFGQEDSSIIGGNPLVQQEALKIFQA